jgi:hypothetical protein
MWYCVHRVTREVIAGPFPNGAYAAEAAKYEGSKALNDETGTARVGEIFPKQPCD